MSLFYGNLNYIIMFIYWDKTDKLKDNKMSIINSLGSIIKQTPKYQKWEDAQQDKEARRSYLAEHKPVSAEELMESDKFAKNAINAINIMDEKSEDAATKTEMANSVLLAIAMYPISFASTLIVSSSMMLGNNMETFKKALLPSLIMLPLVLTGKAWGTSQEIMASKIAREKARENELKDPKNFVIYDNSQIEAAKNRVESNLQANNKKKITMPNIKESLTHIKTIFNEKKNYKLTAEKRAKENVIEEKALKSIKATPEQLNKAEKLQETVLRMIKKINNEAEDYSENIESATGAFLGLGLIADVAFAGLAALATKLILPKMKVSESTENIAALAVAASTTIGGLITEAAISQNMKLNAGKVGRFKVKQELLSDPKNFVSYTDKELESVSEIKAPKQKKVGFFNDLFKDLKFLWNSRKDFKAYDNYKKQILPKEKAFMEELKKSDVSTEQLQKAKHFQNKLFNIFEKIDDKSQEYSEDTEFATETARSLKGIVPLATGAITALAGAIAIKTGLINTKNTSKFISNVFFKGNTAAKELIEETIKTSKEMLKNNNLLGELEEKINLNGLKEQGYKTPLHYMASKIGLSKATIPQEADLKIIKNEIASLVEKKESLKTNISDMLLKFIEKVNNNKTATKFSQSITEKIAKIKKENKFVQQALENIPKDIALIKESLNLKDNRIVNPFNYKWVAGCAGIAGSIGIIGILTPYLLVSYSINYAIESFFTSIQKTAGKIGVMEAINQLDDPRAFIDQSEITKEQKNDMQQFMMKLNKAK